MKKIGILQFAIIALLFAWVGQVCGQPNYTQISFNVKDQKFDMMYVAGGTFTMGQLPRMGGMANAEAMLGRTDTVRVHLADYYIGRYEVTQALWEAVMGKNPSSSIGGDLPVEQVSYAEVIEFISRLNKQAGVTFRLPTEAEWEYAARGGNKSAGSAFPGGRDLMRVGWSRLNSLDKTHPVGMLAANELGLYDMAGNVWEWCSDVYEPEESLHAGEGQTRSHVCRGGSWNDGIEALTVVSRKGCKDDTKNGSLGFRLAISVSDMNTVSYVPRQRYLDVIKEGNEYLRNDTAAERQGALPGVFSVAPDKKVRFAKGNLQYNAASDTWRFAGQQAAFIGDKNSYADRDYDGWIDLFGWGTSGYRERPPYYQASNPGAYGNGPGNNIDGTSYDWGLYNAISNGGNKPGLWRTLSVYEWNYLLAGRPNARMLRAQAKVNGVEGIVLLPDDWLEKGLDTMKGNYVYQFGTERWSFMEGAGAVFLPSAGRCHMGNYFIGFEPIDAMTEVEGVDVAMGSYRESYVYRKSAAVNLSKADDDESFGLPRTDWYGGVNNIDEVKLKYASGFRNNVSGYYNKHFGFYWTTIHYDRRNAMMLTFSIDGSAFLGPSERLTKGSVRLVKDEPGQE